MCQKLGGEAQAAKALKEGDIYAMTDPSSPTKKLYIMREFVDQTAWSSMRERSGQQAIQAALEDGSQAEAMVGQLFTMHEEMPDLMNFIDGKDDVRIPELMYLSGHQRDVPPTQAYGHADGSARHARQDPSWTASTEGAVSRLLTFVNTTQNRLRAAMGGSLSEEQKKFMATHMTHDLSTLTDLQAKYGHLLQHHGFQGRESATTVDEIKKTMKQDIVDINVIDARCKTLQHLEART